MLACLGIVGAICLTRQYFNIDTETDFIGAFMPDADRFARGQPMLILNHPPAYSVALATVNGALGDWMKSGLLLSWLSTSCTLIASYQLFRRVGGSWAAFGAVVGLAVSDVFLAFGAQATSDIPFLALWMTSLALTASALHSGALWRWGVAGLVAGCGALTRSTGIVLVLLVLGPWLTSRSWRSRFAQSAAAAAGLTVPIGAWIWLAHATGSPLAPTENYPTLALAYADGRFNNETMLLMKDRFTSAAQVIAHDPVRLITAYLKNVLRLPGRVLTQTLWPWVGILGAAGLPFWFLKIRDPKVSIVLLTALTGALFATLNPAFEARYYLFLVPLLGASLGHALSLGLERARRSRLAPWAALAGLAALTVIGGLQALPRAHAKAEAPHVRAQLAEAVPAITRSTPPGSVLAARKHNLAFHAQRGAAELPWVTTLDELCPWLQSQLSGGPIYVYVGYAEQRRYRVELARQLLGHELPAWLVVTAEGSAGGGWRLLTVKRGGCGDGRTL